MLCLALLPLFFACEKTDSDESGADPSQYSELIIGKWSVERITASDGSHSEILILAEMNSSWIFTFCNDETFSEEVYTEYSDGQSSGLYTINENILTLLFNDTFNDTFVDYTIQKMNNKTMIIKTSRVSNNGIRFNDTLTLKKI